MTQEIVIQGLTKTYRTYQKPPGALAALRSLFIREWQDKTAIHPIDLTVREGETLGLLGANGAGKTTLVKLLSGIMVPSKGSATVNGFIPWRRHSKFKHQIALIMGQKAQLWWDLPASDCFLLLKEIYRIKNDEYRARVEELVDTLKVGHLLNVQIRRLSLGERMKMELIACLLHRPSVIFLDEPTIGLDISTQKAMHTFLKDYRTKYRPIIILTSHYMADIQALCDRIVILKNGSMAYDGSLEELSQRYNVSKILSFKLEKEDLPKIERLAHQHHLEFHSDPEGQIEITVPKANMCTFSKECLDQIDPIDFSIRDQDISNTIEDIMSGKKAK